MYIRMRNAPCTTEVHYRSYVQSLFDTELTYSQLDFLLPLLLFLRRQMNAYLVLHSPLTRRGNKKLRLRSKGQEVQMENLARQIQL